MAAEGGPGHLDIGQRADRLIGGHGGFGQGCAQRPAAEHVPVLYPGPPFEGHELGLGSFVYSDGIDD